MDPGEIAASRIPAVLGLGYLYFVLLLKSESVGKQNKTHSGKKLRACIFFSPPRSFDIFRFVFWGLHNQGHSTVSDLYLNASPCHSCDCQQKDS
jgi:hypothetical protein